MSETIARVACPICGQTHNWSRHNSVLRDRPRRVWPKSEA
jgi:endogenous inhibitor of DNA gyrase (YacG/DUF329 family)